MASENSLVTLPEKASALDFYKTPGGLDPFIQQVREKVSGIVYDMSTTKGRDECRSDAAKVARSKVAIEKLGKELSAELKAMPKLVDTERSRAYDLLEKLQDEVRAPLTEWEGVEEKRKAAHQAVIDRLAGLAQGIIDGQVADVESKLALLDTIKVDESLEEYHDEAASIVRRLRPALEQERALVAKQKADAEELAKLRAEAAERERVAEQEKIAREAAAKAVADAEEKHRKELADRIQAEVDAKAAADKLALELKLSQQREANQKLQAEADAREAEAKAARDAEAAVQAERDRVAAQQKAELAAAEEREQNKQHRAAVHRQALAELVSCGVDEAAARAAIKAIAKGLVPSISITY